MRKQKQKGGLGEPPNKLYLRHAVASKCDACQTYSDTDVLGDKTNEYMYDVASKVIGGTVVRWLLHS